MAAEFCSTMQASAAEHEAQLRGLHQERRDADEDTVRHHAAAMQGMQQVHELEQVRLLLHCSMLQKRVVMGCLMLSTSSSGCKACVLHDSSRRLIRLCRVCKLQCNASTGLHCTMAPNSSQKIEDHDPLQCS